MKKTLLSLLALALAFTASAQEVKGLVLGYCDGVVTRTADYKSTSKDAWTEAAIHITADEMKTYATCHIDSVRIGLASKLNVDSVVVWLRTSLDGENVAQAVLPKANYTRGWNSVVFDEPYTVPAGLADGLYIGYSYHQKGSCGAISAVLPANPEAYYFKEDGGSWTDKSAEKSLSIEGFIAGDKLPKYNLQLKSMNVQNVFVIDKGTLSISATVRNLASCTITGFDFTTSFSGISETCTTHIEESIAYGEEKTVSFVISPAITTTDPASRAITVTLSKLNEGEDENPLNNTLSDSIEIAQHDYTRAVLLEEFTTEQCPNCPRVAAYIHDIVESGKYDGQLNVVCHHSAFYTDWLTTSFDTDYTWLFNAGGSTYAPAVMYDRDPMGESTPVSNPASQTDMETIIDYRLAQPAFVCLNITAEEDAEDNTLLNVRVTGERSKEEITTTTPRICVTIVEDNIAAQSQAGASNFTHQHVNRVINSTWGEELEWNGNNYDYSCTLKTKTTWEKKNLKVVAYIFGYNKDDATDCVVANSASIAYPLSGPDGISVIGNEAAQEAKTYFTLSGEQVSDSQLRPGIYIVKQGQKTHKEIIK